jgi:membrane-bound serine protease (ClpP class)
VVPAGTSHADENRRGGDAEPPAGPVYLITIDSDIAEGQPHYVSRAVERAEADGAAALVVRLRTFGGLVSAGAAIKDALLASDVPTIAFVDRRAISAGALIALACDSIAMVPGGSIGAATPYQASSEGAPAVSEKMTSAVAAIFRATAEANGYSPELAAAMVDASVAIDGVVPAGKLLTLTTEEAVKLGLATGAPVDLEALLRSRGLDAREVIRVEISPAESLASIIADPYLASLLVSIGMLALIAAFKVPGTGIPEVVVLLAFGAFLFGKSIAGLAGFEDIALIGVGLVLVALEIFVIPGVGAAGIIGALALMAGIILASVGHGPSSPFFAPQLGAGLRTLTLSLVGAGLASVILFFGLRRTKAWKRFSLQQEEPSAESAVDLVGGAPGSPDELPAALLVGLSGKTLTALRPEGEVQLDDRRVKARAERGFIDAAHEVRVVRVEGERAVVREDQGGEEAD